MSTDPYNDESDRLHNRICGRFKRLGLKVKKLDIKNTAKCVDFFVYLPRQTSSGFLCEVKAITKGPFDDETKSYRSTNDPIFMESAIGGRIMDVDEDHLVTSINESLHRAVKQYEETPTKTSINADDVKIGDLPFVVALGFNFFCGFPDRLDFFDIVSNYPKISGLLMLEENHRRKQISRLHLDELTDPKQRARLKTNAEHEKMNQRWLHDYDGTMDEVEFMLIPNERSDIPFRPLDFFSADILVPDKIR